MIWDDINTDTETASATSSADTCMALAMKFCLGKGVTRDNILAHTWFNIAAIKGNNRAKVYRLELSQEMSAAEIAEAQRKARELLTLH
jgi:uncharacterized protein